MKVFLASEFGFITGIGKMAQEIWRDGLEGRRVLRVEIPQLSSGNVDIFRIPQPCLGVAAAFFPSALWECIHKYAVL